jgi:P4 family phage/plasmid primase-like protien
MRKPSPKKPKKATARPKRQASKAKASETGSRHRKFVRSLTDLGNAERLIAAYGANMFFAPFVGRRGSWFVWDETRWCKDDRAQVYQFAREVVRGIAQESKATKVRKWAKSSESRARLEAIVLPSECDANPFFLNVINGSESSAYFFFTAVVANGKSTFLEITRALLGDYAKNTDFGTFLTHHYEGIRNDLARLFGARFVSAVEAERGKSFAEVLLKQLTGGDPVTARFLYNEFFEYYPAFKIVLAANHPPAISESEVAIWRRLHVIPFTVTIPPARRDKQLPDKLRTELSGILNWALEGCREWLQNGLSVPEEVRAATRDYQDTVDPVRRFVRESCAFHPSYSIETQTLFEAYRRWCKQEEERPVGESVFSKRLGDSDLGLHHIRIGRQGTQGISGLRLKPASSNGADVADGNSTIGSDDQKTSQ